MSKVLISNIGFGEAYPAALEILRKNAHIIIENRDRRRFTEQDFIENIGNVDILIAGTEKITNTVLKHASCLKLISRVGVGVDNIDLNSASQKRISISYTPEAPSLSVPEFTLSLILNLLKGIFLSDRKMQEGTWYRPMGHMLSSKKIGIVGTGKIGSKVIQLIKVIAPSAELLFYDPGVESISNAKKCDLEALIMEADLISLHIPLTNLTKNLVDSVWLNKMKEGSYLVNTSRGGIVDEQALFIALNSKKLAGAALDVFETEPYIGPLATLENCLLTSHIGSMTYEVRALMEQQVVEDVVRFLNNQMLIRSLEGFNFAG